MSEVCFYLKDKVSLGKTPIYLQFKYNGQRLKYYFGQSIEPKNWSTAKQRVKSNKTTTTDGQHSVNELLDNLQQVLVTGYRKALSNGIPSKQTLKKFLDDFLHQNEENIDQPNLFTLMDRFISGEIKFRGRIKAKTPPKLIRQ